MDGGRTDRRGSRNSYLDVPWLCLGSSGMKGINKHVETQKHGMGQDRLMSKQTFSLKIFLWRKASGFIQN